MLSGGWNRHRRRYLFFSSLYIFCNYLIGASIATTFIERMTKQKYNGQYFFCYEFGIIFVVILYFFQHIVSITDLIIPNALSLLLSIIHSQIVATACTRSSNNKGKPSLHPKKKKRGRDRRRRKLTRYNEPLHTF